MHDHSPNHLIIHPGYAASQGADTPTSAPCTDNHVIHASLPVQTRVRFVDIEIYEGSRQGTNDDIIVIDITPPDFHNARMGFSDDVWDEGEVYPEATRIPWGKPHPGYRAYRPADGKGIAVNLYI